MGGLALGTTSNNGGVFRFESTTVPPDCVGSLTIGSLGRDVVLNNCIPAPVAVVKTAVPKTGQAQSYAPGDDGDLQRGVAWPVPRLIDNGDGTVTDDLTGLIWLQNADCIRTLNPAFDTFDVAGDGVVTWQQALDFVAGLNTGLYACGDAGGHTDWRLPQIRELFSLFDFGQAPLALPVGHPFENVQIEYWSSTTEPFTGSSGARVITDGHVGYRGKVIQGQSVWAVRGGT